MGSAPFLVEANADSTLMMRMFHGRSLKLSSRKFGSVSGSSFGHSGARGWGRGRVNHLCSRGLLCLVENNKRIRALGNDSGMSEESEKILQGTIEKSKQVLALQNELLQKVSLCCGMNVFYIGSRISSLCLSPKRFMLRPTSVLIFLIHTFFRLHACKIGFFIIIFGLSLD